VSGMLRSGRDFSDEDWSRNSRTSFDNMKLFLIDAKMQRH